MEMLSSLREMLAKDTQSLFAAIGVPFDRSTELQRQLLAAYGFGIVYAEGRTNNLSPSDIHALSITALMDTFKYSPEQATAFTQHLISAASDRNVHPTINAIVHQGIDGHRAIQQGDVAEVSRSLHQILQAVGAGVGS
jgi:hypothetical protein